MAETPGCPGVVGELVAAGMRMRVRMRRIGKLGGAAGARPGVGPSVSDRRPRCGPARPIDRPLLDCVTFGPAEAVAGGRGESDR